MNLSRKALALAALQLVLVASPYAKFKIDRARYPRVWVKTQSIDPYLPIRGRYIAMRLTVKDENPPVVGKANVPFFKARLSVKDGHLVAENAPNGADSVVWLDVNTRRGGEITLQQPILFFLPEHAENAQDLMTAARNGELWAEVTVPEVGLPRPIRVGIKRGDSFTPIEAK
ncbi:MAG TPA: hypothetical protein VMP12_02970 [Candidatus Sulfotelmatobacter sp.]|nr:hypothetical protein [Candidatus Sulfotelmatobacter sp.]